MRVHGFPSTLTVHVAELQGSLTDAENRYMIAYISLEDKVYQVEKHWKGA